MDDGDIAAFAPYVATLGRGPGRSRALTREEALCAFGLVLRRRVDPHQVGAFLILLRYRGEDADEIAGLVEAAQQECGIDGPLGVDLDWPSYGAGRTRTAPWFLLAALALSRAGVRVLMHGTHEFSEGMSVEAALTALGMTSAVSLADAAARVAVERFAYLPLVVLSPAMHRLLGLRALFGLRSPVNTVARLLDPGRAAAGVDGVFHPPYIDVHVNAAERLGRPRLLVLKGGGGEAERNPAKPVTAHLWQAGAGRSELLFPPLLVVPPGEAELVAAWRGVPPPPVLATIALGLVAAGRAGIEDADRQAAHVWAGRFA